MLGKNTNNKTSFTKILTQQFTPERIFECLSIITFITLILSLCFWSDNIEIVIEVPAEPTTPTSMIANVFSFSIAGTVGLLLSFWYWKDRERKESAANHYHIEKLLNDIPKQLADDNISLRIAGIHRVWNTAINSRIESDKVLILDLLCAFIRSEHPSYENKISSEGKKTDFKVGDDVQIAVNLITKNIRDLNLESSYKANFAGANLQKANLIDADLEGANLLGTNLYDAKLQGAKLKGIFFSPDTFDGVKLTQKQCDELLISNHQWVCDGDDKVS